MHHGEGPGSRVAERIAQGVSWGTGIALLLCLWVVIAYLRISPDEPGPTLLQVFAVYLFIGVAGGAVVGLLMPLARRWWGAPIVGIVVMAIAFTAISLMDGQFNITSIVELSLLMGPVLGLGYWIIFRV